MTLRHPLPTSIVFALTATLAAAQVPAGSDFRVNAYTTGNQILPRIAVSPAGDFVVAWSSFGQDGNMYAAIARRYDAAGVARGGEFQLNTYTTGQQAIPVVAAGRQGDFIATWVDTQATGYVQVRRYDRSGNPFGPEFRVDTTTTGYENRPVIARGDTGFVVAWTSIGNIDGSAEGITARAFDTAGNPLGPELVVNSYTTGTQQYAQVGADAAGNFVVVWQDRAAGHEGGGFGIFGQRFDRVGNRLGAEFQVNTFTPGDQNNPSVSVSRAGDFVVVWTSPGVDGHVDGVAARRFDAQGSPIGNEFVVNTYTTGFQRAFWDAVTHDERGNFVIVWQRAAGVLGAQRFDASGARRGLEFQVNSYTTGIHQWPSLRSDAVGNFVVAWESYSQDGSGRGVFARRFGGLVPALLAVDAGGNGVLEPGETADVRPAWRNVNGAPQTFTGTLAGITGPAGLTYTITDGAGSYGTVANDIVAACTDCYAVAVGNGAPRPAGHVDASAVETISPDVQGQQKRWTLHVGDSFSDVGRASPFYRFVETLLHHGVTGGCSATSYCSALTTTREQMAVFALVAKEGAGYVPSACGATPVFADVPVASPFCRWIEELARRGVVGGCGNGNYCPASPVSRDAMAVFVLRTLDPSLNPPACVPPNLFNDVPETSPFCRWVEELATRGVVTGCGGGNYCPTASVTREQMGVFIGVTFGLTLYGP